MGLSGKGSKVAGVVAVFAVFFMMFFDEDQRKVAKFEMGTLLLSPFMQLGWKSGLLGKLILKSYDESDMKYPRLFMSQQHFDKIQRFEAKPDHLYIATFPKSGTHFTMQLSVQVAAKGQAKFENVHQYTAALEMELLSNPECGDVLDMDNLDDFDKTPWKVVMTHLGAQHVPYSKDAKYIVVMRNGIDTLVSFQNMIANVLPPSWMPGEDTFFELFFKDEPSGWARYYAAWWEKKSSSDNILFLFYEDMVKNLEEAVINVTSFLGMEVDNETVQQVKYLASIDYMKPNAKLFEPPSCFTGSASYNKRKMNMVNKGKVGRGKRFVSPHIRQKIRDNYRKAFLGTDFPIERYLDSL